MEKMQIHGITDRERAFDLLTAVRSTVQLNSRKYHIFISVLKNGPSRKDIVDILTAAYQNSISESTITACVNDDI
jgi:hypothetical protein